MFYELAPCMCFVGHHNCLVGIKHKIVSSVFTVCVYKGKSYTQGQRWQDGCDYECVCDDAMTGHYMCTDR